jgi:hypothetical protein
MGGHAGNAFLALRFWSKRVFDLQQRVSGLLERVFAQRVSRLLQRVSGQTRFWPQTTRF